MSTEAQMYQNHECLWEVFGYLRRIMRVYVGSILGNYVCSQLGKYTFK